MKVNKRKILSKKMDQSLLSGKQSLTPLLLLLLSCINLLPSVSIAGSWNLEETLREYVKSVYPWPEVVISDVQVKGNMPDIKPSKVIIQKGMPGKTVFLLEFKSSKILTVNANVKAFDNVISVKRAFKKGYILQKDDLYNSLMDVQRIPADAVKDINYVIGKSISRSILANTPITHGMLTNSYIVKKGRKVMILVEGEKFRVSTMGETKENSSVGSYVKAINITSKKIVTGLLVDENTVKVEL